MTDKVAKPSLTVEEEARKQFEKWMAGVSREYFERDTEGTYRYIRIQGKWEAWQASRRRTLGGVISKLRIEEGKHHDACDLEGIGATHCGAVLGALADELESELKKEQP